MTKQPLLNLGSLLRDRLENIASAENTRWQDLARQVLQNFVDMKVLENAAANVSLEPPSNVPSARDLAASEQ